MPETVRELIEQMLEQLGPGDRELLAAASAVGQEFSVAALAAAVALPVADVDARCDALARAGSFIEATGEEQWPDGTQAARYRFTHDLHREVLYSTLLSGRRAETHSRIGRRLEAAYGASSKEIAAKLAEQFVRAGDTERKRGRRQQKLSPANDRFKRIICSSRSAYEPVNAKGCHGRKEREQQYRDADSDIGLRRQHLRWHNGDNPIDD